VFALAMIVWRREVREVLACESLDETTLDALLRAQLAARRCGMTIELDHVTPKFADLIALLGLDDVFPSSAVDVDRETEQREEVGVDVEVDPGDTPV
jgi:hypothetical protein